MVLLGVGDEDTDRDLEYLVEKIVGLRIFQDENDKMNLSLMDVKGELLVISQFTLYGDVRKGKRPSFIKSARPDIGKMYYEEFIEKTKSLGIKTEKGIFGAHMDVNLINNGPVTILLDSKKIF
jgi:D-tyrosyl-tRNA(Tyr) deacylase